MESHKRFSMAYGGPGSVSEDSEGILRTFLIIGKVVFEVPDYQFGVRILERGDVSPRRVKKVKQQPYLEAGNGRNGVNRIPSAAVQGTDLSIAPS